MKRFCSALLFAASLAVIAGPVSAEDREQLAPTSGWYLPPHPRTFAEFLASGQDLVVTGTVQSVSETIRGYARMPELIRHPVTEISLTIDDVLSGSSPSTNVEVTLIDTGYNLVVGDRVLVWANYTPEDGWRLRGRCRKFDGDQLTARPNEPVFSGPQGPQMVMSYATVRSELAAIRQPSAVYNGTRTLVLARLRGSSRWSESGAVYEVDSLACLMGSVEAMPKIIRFPALAGCSPGIYPGDSLLVPIPPGFRGAVLPLAHCPSALRVKNCFVPGLGVMVTELRRSIDSVGVLLHVRSVQRQER